MQYIKTNTKLNLLLNRNLKNFITFNFQFYVNMRHAKYKFINFKNN